MSRSKNNEELTALVYEMGEMVRRARSAFPQMAPGTSAPISSQIPIDALETIYAYRRARDEVFGKDADLFGEPAWDMLLDLAIQESRSKRVHVSSALIGAQAPATTALRWLGLLEERGLVDSVNDDRDARRRYVSLSAKGRRMLREFVEKLIDGGHVRLRH